MKSLLSVVVITKNAENLIGQCLNSVKGLADEIVVIDDYSTDKTVEITRKYGAKVYLHHENDFGKQKACGISKAKEDWILVLDSDEIVSEALKNEIKKTLEIRNFTLPTGSQESEINGYNIPFQTHFLGKLLKYGGEDYKKLVLFKRNAVAIKPALVHEKFQVKNGKASYLKNKIYHYSYRSLWQMFKKFTDYGYREARQKKLNGEKASFKKIFLYPPHMFWARFIKGRGYKDGLFRIPLDLGFAYMEFLTYFLMIFL